MSSDHFFRQLRFVVPGACITLWLRTPSLIARIWTEAAPFARFVSVFGVLSVTLIISLLPLQVAGWRVSSVGLANDRAVFVYPFDSCDQGTSTRCASLIIKFQSCYIRAESPAVLRSLFFFFWLVSIVERIWGVVIRYSCAFPFLSCFVLGNPCSTSWMRSRRFVDVACVCSRS